MLVLPAKYINEIKSLPEGKVSFNKAVEKRFVGEHTTLGHTDDALTDAVRMDLTRNIPKSLEVLQDEASTAIPDTIGPCPDWKPITVYSACLRMVALLSGRVFVGLPLCRNEEWIQTTSDYTRQIFVGGQSLLPHSPIMRAIIAPFNHSIRTLKDSRRKAARLLAPIIAERLANTKSPGYKPQNDMITWYLERLGDDAANVERNTWGHLMVSMAAMHTTTMNVTHVMYELCAHPEYVGPLREEIEGILAADHGVFVKTSMTKLWKLDSLLKETQRFHPPGLGMCTSS